MSHVYISFLYNMKESVSVKFKCSKFSDKCYISYVYNEGVHCIVATTIEITSTTDIIISIGIKNAFRSKYKWSQPLLK